MNDNELTIEQMEFLLGQMKKAQHDFQTQKIVYDLDKKRIIILYQLPPDFKKLKDLKI